MAKMVKITIMYPHEDEEVTMDEEKKHWEDGSIDVPTIRDAGEMECTVTAELV